MACGGREAVTVAKTPLTGTKPKSAGGQASDRRTEAAVEALEHALTRVARAVLRLGVPPHALGEGEQIDRAGYWALVRLDEATDAVRLSDLAALLELDLSTVSRQIRHLVDSGLVIRESDPVDGRACLLSLSPRGRSVLDAVRDARCQVLQAALGEWRGEERAEIAAALTRLADDLQPAGHASPGTDSPRTPPAVGASLR
jgi:DNA-binding MarR family transcriptional regulator